MWMIVYCLVLHSGLTASRSYPAVSEYTSTSQHPLGQLILCNRQTYRFQTHTYLLAEYVPLSACHAINLIGDTNEL